MEAARLTVAKLVDAASRLDELADVAELMGDSDGADRLRAEGYRRREQAMLLLDDDSPTA